MLSKNWIAGFTDGEGSFGTWIGIRHKKIATVPSFRIRLHYKDKNILEKIQKTIGVGTINYYTYKQKNNSPCYVFSVDGKKDCLKLRNFFGCSLQSKKKKDFILWSIALEFIKHGWHLTKEGLIQIAMIRDKMNKTNGIKHPKYRTTKDIIKLIDIHDIPTKQRYITHWNETDISFLSEKYIDKNIPAKEIAKKLNRSIHAIHSKTRDLKLKRGIKQKIMTTLIHNNSIEWSKHETSFLSKTYTNQNIPIKTIAKKLGRSIQAVYNKASQIGLKRKNKNYNLLNIYDEE
jgi:hypothetical protein